MDNNKSWNSIGQEIRDAVETALKTGDFRDLGDTVVDAVSDVARDVTAKVGQAVSGITGENQTFKWESATRERKYAQEEQRAKQAEIVRQRAPFRKVGRISSVLYKVFGGIGTGIMGILSAIFLGVSIGNGGGWWITFSVLSMVLMVFITMIGVGCKQKKRLERAEKYLELAGNNHYINLEDLALHTNATPQFVLKEIRKMLMAGHFPQGHLDTRESCLMLDDKIYREYLDLEKQRKIQEREQRAQELRNAAAGKTQNTAPKGGGAGDAELNAMIEEGQECIRKLRDMNDNIPGEEISAKLFRLENLLKEICEGLREHPEQKYQMQKFMNYYLPTTIKLVEAYEEFDDLSSQSREIIEAKAEIEKTLDTINSAFEELLHRMFRDTAFDVTTDAQVLQTMLAKEGLAGQDVFSREREPEKVPR